MIEIKNPIDCCGCTACESICAHNAITMKEDEEGFLYPVLNVSSCVECGLCNNVCPIVSRKSSRLSPTYKKIYAIRNKNKNTLLKSSSGGAFSLIAKYIIDHGGYVVGAIYNENMIVCHTITNDMAGVEKMRGSKYSQSNMGNTFRDVKKLLRNGEFVLFTGTPCQVDGLKKFLRKDYKNLLTMDVVCHAVPSPKIFNEYLQYVEKRLNKRIVNLIMRDKQKHGWSHIFSYRYIFNDGTEKCDPLWIKNWGTIYFSRLIDRPSCHHCLYTNYSRCSDITVADFWDDKKLRKDIYSNYGTSLFIVNTQSGSEVFDEIKDTCYYWDITKNESYQPCLETPTIANPLRMDFWIFYKKNGFIKTYNKFFDDSIYIKIKKVIKIIIGRA